MSQIILTKYLIYGNMHISDIFIEHFTVFYKKYLSAFRVKVMQHIEYFILFLHLSFFFSYNSLWLFWPLLMFRHRYFCYQC